MVLARDIVGDRVGHVIGRGGSGAGSGRTSFAASLVLLVGRVLLALFPNKKKNHGVWQLALRVAQV